MRRSFAVVRATIVSITCLICCASLSGAAAARTQMTGPMTFYIDALPSYPCPAPSWQCEYGIGDDANDGLSQATPWATFEHAMGVLQAQYDFAGQKPKLVVMAAPAAGCVMPNCRVKYYLQNLVVPPFVGQESGVLLNNCSTVNFRIGSGIPALQVESSDPTNPIGAFIQPPAPPAGQPTRAAITILPGASAQLDGLAVDTQASNSDGIDLFGSAVIKRFLWGGVGVGGSVHMAVGPSTWVLFDGPGIVYGGAYAWVSVSPGGRFDVNNNGASTCPVTLTFAAPVNFVVAFAEAYDGGAAFLYQMNFVNKNLVTGRKAHLVGGAHMIVNGLGAPDLDYLPGDQPAIIDSKSSYR